MAARNSVKDYLNNGYYHLYNRGVDKQLIFKDGQDYCVLQTYLSQYLLAKDEAELQSRLASPNISYFEKDKILKLLRLNNFAEQISLLAYCLMPNHFHFLVKQTTADTIDRFLNSIGVRYSMYFNQKYKRVGPLYQGVYKAVLVTSDEQLLHLSRYIHKQALTSQEVVLQGQPSSYLEYLGQRTTSWINTKEILSFFSKVNPSLSYKSFVNQDEDFIYISKLTIE